MERRVKARRLTQTMYVPPAMRATAKNANGMEMETYFTAPIKADIKVTNDNTDEKITKSATDPMSFTEDNINELLSSFVNLNIYCTAERKKMEHSFLKLTKTLVEGINNQPKAIVEKLVVTLINQGKMLHDDNPAELDSLIALIRDKILERETQPATKRYLFHVVEWRAREFRLV